MATHSAPPDLDAVEDAIRGIAPLMEAYVEPHLRTAAIGIAEAPPPLELSLKARLSGDPVHYVHVLASARGFIQSGSQAEGLWLTARVLIATRFYCVRLDPLAAELREVARAGGDPNDPDTRNAIMRRLQESGPAIDDSAEHKFLAALERLDATLLAARQATVGKLCRVARNPLSVRAPELRNREVVMAQIRALLHDMRAAARSAFTNYEQPEFPRTRREWNRAVSRLGADLKRLGFTHRRVASIFHGTHVGSKTDSQRRADERARQRTRRQRRVATSVRRR